MSVKNMVIITWRKLPRLVRWLRKWFYGTLRVFGLSQSEANRWSAAVPNKLKITLEEAYQESKRMQELVNFSPNNQLLYKTAVQLEGLPRHVSTHAAGVVISDENLLNLVPLQPGSNEILLTQFTMNDVEKLVF